MGIPRFLEDSYLNKFKTKVKSVKDKFIILENTIFYASSGGQEYDTGSITRLSDNKEFKVIYARWFSGEISNEVDQEGLKENDEVICKLNWGRRYKHMRSHTATHIITSLIQKETNALITGNQITEEKVRFDVNMENFSKEKIESFIEKTNKIIQEDHLVKSFFVGKEDIESGKYSSGLKEFNLSKILEKSPKIRIVEIENIDLQPDGGTHIKSTREIGPIKLLEIKNKGANNKRVYFTLE
jgi:misacylated tRNA(Ala) deacylase